MFHARYQLGSNCGKATCNPVFLKKENFCRVTFWSYRGSGPLFSQLLDQGLADLRLIPQLHRFMGMEYS